jgi:group I intron endonuclease
LISTKIQTANLYKHMSEGFLVQSLVYQWTNTINGKRYIGYTDRTVEERWVEHQRDARLGCTYPFHSAIRKYGASSFVSEVLFVEESTRAAKETEILLILDRCPEYNKTRGGDCGPIMTGDAHPMFGKKRPDLSERNSERVWSEEDRLRAAEKQTGKRASEGAKLKMSQARTGVKRGSYNVTSDGVSVSNRSRKGTKAAALAAKKASDVRWARYRAEKARLAQETRFPE